MEPFKMRKKNVKENYLIWHMVGEMIKKQGRERLYISCNYSCTSYFEMKILLVKEPSHFSMLKAKLLHSKTYINQKCKGCKGGGIYQNL